jgi:hypothetical protein
VLLTWQWKVTNGGLFENAIEQSGSAICAEFLELMRSFLTNQEGFDPWNCLAGYTASFVQCNYTTAEAPLCYTTHILPLTTSPFIRASKVFASDGKVLSPAD